MIYLHWHILFKNYIFFKELCHWYYFFNVFDANLRKVTNNKRLDFVEKIYSIKLRQMMKNE